VVVGGSEYQVLYVHTVVSSNYFGMASETTVGRQSLLTRSANNVEKNVKVE
jgi:hypothetical protein